MGDMGAPDSGQAGPLIGPNVTLFMLVSFLYKLLLFAAVCLKAEYLKF
jgi:hypothetical protein